MSVSLDDIATFKRVQEEILREARSRAGLISCPKIIFEVDRFLVRAGVKISPNSHEEYHTIPVHEKYILNEEDINKVEEDKNRALKEKLNQDIIKSKVRLRELDNKIPYDPWWKFW